MKLFILLMLSCACITAQAQLSADLEGSWIFSVPYNVVRIPAQGGTEFDLAHDLKQDPAFAVRGRLNFTIARRHVISALVAPLSIRSSGSLSIPVRYDDQLFAANTPLEAKYTFNSYRLTYRYLFIAQDHLEFGAGLTAKIRQASIQLRSGNQTASFSNLGAVPLVHVFLNWSPGKKWMFLLEGDALVASQGRAEDVFAGVGYRITRRLALKGGYRVLEGGADVELNYNFSFINYAVAGLLFNY